jgi:acetylglutamate kinase
MLRAQSGASLGFVGDVTHVDASVLAALLDAGFLPVVAPLALDEGGDGALNVNADATAGAIAGALHADAFVIVTDVARVRRVASDPQTAVAQLDAHEARELLSAGAFEGGMRPKIESALTALARGARRVAIAGAGPRAVGRALEGEGTTLLG